MEDMAFLFEIQRLALEIDSLVDKYNMRERFVSVLVSGFIDVDDFGDTKMNAIYSYHLANITELAEIIDFLDYTFDQTYDESDPIINFDDEVDDLLNDLGIETE
jgi:hypothetical protein